MSFLTQFGPRMMQYAMRPPERDAKLNIPVGSVRSGKTWGHHAKTLYLCDYQVGGRKVFTGISKENIYRNVLTDLFDIIGSRNWNYNKQSGELRLFNSRWQVIGARDEGSEKYLRGSTIGVALCDEVTLMPQSFFQMLLSRLSPPGARLYGTTNADTPYHWLKKDYLDNPELKGILWSSTFTMDDNPNLDPLYVEQQKRLYTGVFYQRFIEGKWVMAEGAVYGNGIWSTTRNTYAEAPTGLYGNGGSNTQHIIAVDYGTTNPCTFLDGIDDGVTLRWDNEYYWDSKKTLLQKTDEQYADDLDIFITESNCPLRPMIIIDPSAASFKVTLQQRGHWVVDANNEVADGIRRTGTALQRGLVQFHNGKCPNAIREHQSYSWAKKKEEPLKENDHTCDAARYGHNHVFQYNWRLGA